MIYKIFTNDKCMRGSGRLDVEVAGRQEKVQKE